MAFSRRISLNEEIEKRGSSKEAIPAAAHDRDTRRSCLMASRSECLYTILLISYGKVSVWATSVRN